MLVDNVYQEMEVWYPLFRFIEAGAKVTTIGAVAGQTYTSKLGYPVKEMIGGFEYWTREGLPVETAAGIDRHPTDRLTAPLGIACAC